MKGFGKPVLDESILKLYKGCIWQGVLENLSEFGAVSPLAFFRTNLRIVPESGTIVIMVGGQELLAAVQLTNKGSLAIVELDNVGEEGKALSASLIQELAQRWQANFVAFVAEAWVVTHESGEQDIGKITLIPPRLNPDRGETIAITMSTPKGHWGVMVPIIRDEERKPTVPQKPPPPELLNNLAGGFVVNF